MSRPSGPPPYTAEQIALLDTAEARFIAKSELNSYIAGHRIADLRDQGLLGAPTYVWTNPMSSPLMSDASPNEDSNSGTMCPNFTSTGKCTRVNCFDVHDVNKLALCKAYLYKDDCTKGEFCSLSHRATQNNKPHCTYFLENRCKKSPCSFLHAHVDRHAPVCDSFGRLGYCEEGEDCDSLHVYECPDFANSGTCAAGESCPLRHVHHASRMKATARNSGIGSPESAIDDDSDMEGVSPPTEIDSHAITQQHDYVAFDSEE